MQYTRNESDFSRGTFRVRGDTIDVFPAEHSELAIRIELFDDEIEIAAAVRPADRPHPPEDAALRGLPVEPLRDAARHACCARSRRIKDELRERLDELVAAGKLVEAQRLEQRTRFDLEMLQEIGHCKGIENYTRHLSGAAPGEPPPTLVDYLPKDALMFLDESHVLIGQLGGMYNGDRARKTTLVEYGFRLPSRAGQPAAEVRGVRGARCARRSSSRPRRPHYEQRACRPGGRAAGAADRPDRSRGRGAAGHAPGRRRAAGDPRARRERASAC